MSVESVLRGAYGNPAVARLDTTTDVCLREGERFAVLVGHVAHVPGFYPFRYRYTFTLLRHPVARALSVYYYFCRQGGGGTLANTDPAAGVVSLEDFVAEGFPGSESIADFQTRHFAAMQAGDQPGDTLAFAQAALRGYHLVGVQEQFEEFLRLLTSDLGLPEITAAPQENVTPSLRRAEDIPVATRAAIERRNPLDLALWEWARAEFASRAARAPARVIVLSRMRDESAGQVHARARVSPNSADVVFIGCAITAADGRKPPFVCGELVRLRIVLFNTGAGREVTVGFGLSTPLRQELFATNTQLVGRRVDLGARTTTEALFEFPATLAPGHYFASISCHEGRDTNSGSVFVWEETGAEFDVVNRWLPGFGGLIYLPVTVGCGAWTPTADSPWMAPLTSPTVGVRLRPVGDNVSAKLQARCGQRLHIPFTLQNGSNGWLLTAPPYPVHIAYHIRRSDQTMFLYDGRRTPLMASLAPGGRNVQDVIVEAPGEPGSFLLEVTLVQEGQFWFESVDPETATVLELEVHT